MGQVTQEVDILLIMVLMPIKLFGISVSLLAENFNLLDTQALYWIYIAALFIPILPSNH